jgi:hypothetical protein
MRCCQDFPFHAVQEVRYIDAIVDGTWFTSYPRDVPYTVIIPPWTRTLTFQMFKYKEDELLSSLESTFHLF